MRKRLRLGNHELVHARFGQCGLVARAQLKVPVVITYGGSDVLGSSQLRSRMQYKNYLLRAVSRLLSFVVDEVIVVSRHLGEALGSRDYHVIPSGVDFTMFRPINRAEARERIGFPIERRLVLFAGSPENSRKRFDLARQACDLAGSEVDLALIPLTGRPSKDVPVFMSACDVLLVTSDIEGSPNVVKEALACNLPVVSVDVGDVREQIGGIQDCRLCQGQDPRAIADALLQVLATPRRLAARDAVRAELDSAVFATKVSAVYEKALKGHTRRTEAELPESIN